MSYNIGDYIKILDPEAYKEGIITQIKKDSIKVKLTYKKVGFINLFDEKLKEEIWVEEKDVHLMKSIRDHYYITTKEGKGIGKPEILLSDAETKMQQEIKTSGDYNMEKYSIYEVKKIRQAEIGFKTIK